MKKIGLFMMVLLAVLACSMAKPKQAEAAMGYKQMFRVMEMGDTKKVGKYEFHIAKHSNERVLEIRSGKAGNFKETPIRLNSYVNEEDAYYVRQTSTYEKAVLYKYVFAAGKESKVMTLPMKYVEEYWGLSMAYGNRIYLTRGIYDKSLSVTYTYDTKKGKLSKVRKNCEFVCNNGSYAVSSDEFATDVSANSITLYKFTASGIRKVRRLSKHGRGFCFIEDELFYASYSDGSMMHGVTIYKCKADGIGKKKLAVFKAPKGFGQMLIYDITEKSCKVSDGTGNKIYEFNYATKKMKEIES